VPLFRRRRDAAPSTAERGAPGRATERGFDWRSYDAVAQEYERALAPHTQRVVADLLDAAELRAGERLLDVGAGTGRGVESATERGAVAFGVDAAPHMLEVARHRKGILALAAADVVDLPFDAEIFDIVVATFTLPYFVDMKGALFDLLRVLRPGGRLAVATWANEEDQLSRTWLELVDEAVGVEVVRDAIKDEAPWTELVGDKSRLEGLLRDAGLHPVEVERRDYRFEMPPEDYLLGHEVEATGRFVRSMLGPPLWESFRERARATFADRYPGERLGDSRAALLAVGRKP
jgi:ubiquinone/menaquinone biosynthesis C-methylase UbiE